MYPEEIPLIHLYNAKLNIYFQKPEDVPETFSQDSDVGKMLNDSWSPHHISLTCNGEVNHILTLSVPISCVQIIMSCFR